MNKFDRVTAILIQLQSKKVVKAQEIADRFEVSLRTVYRDIRTLERAGIPILSEAGVGYSIMEGYRLPPVLFTEEEATAFLLAEKLVDKMVDHTTRTHFESAMYKIKSVLRSGDKQTIESISDFIEIPDQPSAFIANIQKQYLQDIFQSIKNRQSLQISYEKEYVKESSKRSIEPLGIYFLYDNWHLIAYCQMRQDYRDFRLDRIQAMQLEQRTFTKEHVSIKEYLAELENRRHLQEVVVSFSKMAVRFSKTQKYFYGLIKEEERGDRIEMTFLSATIPGIARWLLFFGKGIEIIKPEALRLEMKELAQMLYEHHR